MDNGKANLFIQTSDAPTDMLEILKDSIIGDIEDGKGIIHYSVKEVEISSLDDEKITLDIDGDKGPDLPIKIRILKEAVEVYLPDEVKND